MYRHVCVRLHGGVVLAARHCVMERGKCLTGITAFGGELEVGPLATHWVTAQVTQGDDMARVHDDIGPHSASHPPLFKFKGHAATARQLTCYVETIPLSFAVLGFTWMTPPEPSAPHLQFAGAQAHIDTAVFKIKDEEDHGSCSYFHLAEQDARPGTNVALLAYPLVFDKELQFRPNSKPAIDTGIVTQVNQLGTYAATTFSTGAWRCVRVFFNMFNAGMLEYTCMQQCAAP